MRSVLVDCVGRCGAHDLKKDFILFGALRAERDVRLDVLLRVGNFGADELRLSEFRHPRQTLIAGDLILTCIRHEGEECLAGVAVLRGVDRLRGLDAG